MRLIGEVRLVGEMSLLGKMRLAGEMRWVGETSLIVETKAFVRKKGLRVSARYVLIWTVLASSPPQPLFTTVDFVTVVTNVCKRPFLKDC